MITLSRAYAPTIGVSTKPGQVQAVGEPVANKLELVRDREQPYVADVRPAMTEDPQVRHAHDLTAHLRHQYVVSRAEAGQILPHLLNSERRWHACLPGNFPLHTDYVNGLRVVSLHGSDAYVRPLHWPGGRRRALLPGVRIVTPARWPERPAAKPGHGQQVDEAAIAQGGPLHRALFRKAELAVQAKGGFVVRVDVELDAIEQQPAVGEIKAGFE